MIKHRLQEAWIGLNAMDTDGNFIWSDGTPLDFIDWSREDSPDQNTNPQRQDDENCVVTDTSSGHDEWDIRPCHAVNGYFCQRTLDSEAGLAEMPGRPPDEEWIPPPIDANPTPKAPQSNSEENPLLQKSPDITTDEEIGQSSDKIGQSNAGTPSTSLPLEPQTSEIIVQDPDVPVLSDLPASQRAILDDFAQPLPTTTPEPWWLHEANQEPSLTKCDTTDYRPLTSGTIAGIILGCLLGSGIIASGLIYLYHHHVATSVIRREKLSFDNALYNPNADQIQLNTNEETSTTPA